MNTIGMLAYAFKGIGKFAVTMLPVAALDANRRGCSRTKTSTPSSSWPLTSLYAIKGGMISVVITEVMQFTILTATSLIIGVIAMFESLAGDDRKRRFPPAGPIRFSAGSSTSIGPASSTQGERRHLQKTATNGSASSSA